MRANGIRCLPYQKICPNYQGKHHELLGVVDTLANVYPGNPILAHSLCDMVNQFFSLNRAHG